MFKENSLFLWPFSIAILVITRGYIPIESHSTTIPTVFQFSYCFPIVFLWLCYDFPVVCLWFFHVFPMVFLRFLWLSYGCPMVFPWFSYGFPMVFLRFFRPSLPTHRPPRRVGDGIPLGLRVLARRGLHVTVQDPAPGGVREDGGVDAAHVGAVAVTLVGMPLVGIYG